MIYSIFKILSPLSYMFSAVYFFFYFNRREARDLKLARYLDSVSILIHFLFLLSLSLKIGHLPLAGAFQALSVFMFFFALLNKIFVPEGKDYSLGVFYSGILFILQTISVIFISESAVLPDILKDITFEVHVILNLVGYAAFSSAFLVASMYILLFFEIKSRRLGYFYERLPSLVYLEKLTYRALVTGFIFNTLGVFSGAFTGFYAWGTFWAWDPKLVSAILAWVLYGTTIIGKSKYHWPGKRIASFSFFGFLWIIFSMIIVTQYFSGIHSFK